MFRQQTKLRLAQILFQCEKLFGSTNWITGRVSILFNQDSAKSNEVNHHWPRKKLDSFSNCLLCSVLTVSYSECTYIHELVYENFEKT